MTIIHNNKKPMLIYIAGYGRSGSTVLGAILGSHPSIVGLGEITTMFGVLSQSKGHALNNCSCGKSFNDCDYWQNILESSEYNSIQQWANIHKTFQKVEDIRSLLILLRGGFSEHGNISHIGAAYADYNHTLLNSLVKRNQQTIFVDSSKTVWNRIGRPYALQELVGLDVKVIHLIRDGRATMWSRAKGKNRTLAQKRPSISILRGLLGAALWSSTNLLTSVLLLRVPNENVLRIHYEDLIDDAEHTMQELGQFIGQDLSDITRKLVNRDSFMVSNIHLAGGNRLLKNGSFVVKVDKSWRKQLPAIGYVLFYLIFTPFWLLYRRKT
jgi:hypothetical protein